MKPTIRTIAEAAMVSRGTVDKVLNNRPGVSQEVRDKVRKISEEMGYQPNLAGKALAYQKHPLKIGVVILNKNDSIFHEIYKGIHQAFEELKDFGISIETLMMENITGDEQLKCIKELRQKNIAALALSPLEEEFIREELQELAKEDVKIVTFNTDIAGIEKLCFIGQNLVQSGRVAGELMGKLLPNGGEIAIITGSRKIKALQERVQGFKEILEGEYVSLKITEMLEDVGDNDTSYVKTLTLLEKYSDLKAIYITGRGVGGVGKALQQLNRRDIKLVSFDTAPETVELISNKIIDFTITQEPFMQGYLPIKMIFDYFFKNQMPLNENIYTKLQIVTKENMDY
ncbi:LacI family transcriptional regulator [Anaerovirgula multivorans]|uniref:LacI family transcriptional regulator n=1 Tax=Anaerovirgula multivorans TaxID=312168 RepID=A0A239C0G1_9FIRM|nr:LacI family DNA-binding transcriptional regulator [Anaerovirgula multivorans]SNS13382.1 LacI family transcriptional regulator [Anaerovirgula multivorans]